LNPGILESCIFESGRIQRFFDSGLGIGDWEFAGYPAGSFDGFPRFVRFQAGKQPDQPAASSLPLTSA
jgi:hypothetical protein